MKHLSGCAKTIIKHCVLLVFSALFMLVFALWTSPLRTYWYGCDASFFTMAGRGILEGWIPYVDFFDLKGPCFFFIEALGQLILRGRTGIWILEVLFFYASLYLIIRLARLFLSVKKSLFIAGVFCIFHISTLWGGNTLEEFMLPLSLLSIYLTISDIMKLSRIRALTAMITGISFGIMLFSKVTVAAPIIALVLTVIIIYCKNKQLKPLIEYLLFALLGLLIITTAVFIYFAANDALIDMLYSVFVFAFKRGTDTIHNYNLKWELKISGCYFAIIYVICQVAGRGRRGRASACATINTGAGADTCTDTAENISDGAGTYTVDDVNAVSVSQCNETCMSEGFLLTLVACCGTVTAALLHLGDPFIYYFTTVYPTLVLTLIAMLVKYEPFTIFKSWRLDIPLIAFIFTVCCYASYSASTLNTVIYDRKNTYYESYVNAARDMAALIPLNERDNVYSINIDMQWFEINEILPCYSYTINLQYFIDLDPAILDKILMRFGENPPKWLVTGGDLAGYIPKLNDVVFHNYTELYSNDYATLYLLNQ